MTEIHRSADCGNSPKNGLAEDIAVALETRGVEFLTDMLDPGVEWRHEDGVSSTATDVVNRVAAADVPQSLSIDHVVSHGKVAAVIGSTRDEQRERRFCHVLEFTSAAFKKIRRIESFAA